MKAMAFNFSQEQLDSINAEGCNYLISAGAGSGKTAVLTNRIYRLAKKTKSLDNFLVMTFTNLAAARMKEKVRGLLFEDPETKSLASEVDSAHIETFDSFNLFLVKKYFYLLGVSKNISIVQNEILSIKRKNFLDEIFLEEITKNNVDLINLLQTYSIKNNDEVKNVIIKLIEVSDSKIDKYGFINSLKDKYFTDEYINELINNLIKDTKEYIRYLSRLAEELDCAEDSESIIAYFDRLLACKKYDEFYYFANTENKEDMFPKKIGGKTEDGDYRNSIKDRLLKRVFSKFELNEQDLINGIKKTKPHVNEIIRLAVLLENKVDAYKKEHNVFTFSDLSRMSYSLLENPDICEELKNQFDYIMIDEYQDTNDVQEAVINKISKNNIYMVGDIKQSIYRFRNADCTIFNEKYNKYKLGEGGKEIDLNNSYRSRKEIVDFINDAFSKIMVRKNNPIEYSNGHVFGYGNKGFDNPPTGTDYKVEEYRYEYVNSDENLKKEVEIVINDIIHKYNSRYLIFDGKEYRPCDFKDFCIIIDRETDFDAYIRAFSEAKIPLNVNGKDDVKKCDVFTVIKSLTKMLYLALNSDYSHEYRHAFMSVSRSFINSINDKALHELVTSKDGSKVLTSKIAQKIELIKERLRYASLEEVLKTLIDEFEIYEKLSRIGEFYKNTHKIETLINYATQMDLLGFTLKDFVSYFDDLLKSDLKIEYRDKEAQSNSVTLINIHQSKGLEYEIIYYVGLAKAFARNQYNDSMFATKEYGVILPYVDNDKTPLIKTLYKENDIIESNKERIRVLYVALTRARQKAILIYPVKENEKKQALQISDVNSLKDIYLLADLGDKYLSTIPEKEELVLRSGDTKFDVEKAELKKVNIKTTIVEKKHASKTEIVDVDEDLLIFGTELHGYLEGLDFNNPDLEKITYYRIKKIIPNVINSKIFKNLENSQVLHEYSFNDEKNNVRGVIDCLIIKDNEIDIVDFKLKHLDDEAYNNQLRTYKKYISSISDKPVKMYLLAALTGELREVKDE